MILERGMICSRLHLRHFNSMPCAIIFASRLPQRHRCSCGSSLGSLNSTKTSFCVLLFPLTRLASAVDPLRKHGKTRQESPHSKLSCDEENKMSDRKEEPQDERRFIAYEKSLGQRRCEGPTNIEGSEKGSSKADRCAMLHVGFSLVLPRPGSN